MPERRVHVRTDWTGWQAALVSMTDLEDVHWHRPPDAPVPILHAYVSCSKVAGGALCHACDPATAPHRLLVCVLKRSVDSSTYNEIAGRIGAADPLPLDNETALVGLERRSRVRRPALRMQIAVGAAVGSFALWWIGRRRKRVRRRYAA